MVAQAPAPTAAAPAPKPAPVAATPPTCPGNPDALGVSRTVEIDTAGGQSGAPVWMKMADGSRLGVGVHTNGAVTGNSATRICQPVFDNITAWKASVP